MRTVRRRLTREEQAPSTAEVPDKFMVCDHCHGHGLPCNELPICDQCQLFEVACVHRLCKNSPYSREGCSDFYCRYAHLDHEPVPQNKPSYHPSDYIVLNGHLRRYRADGEIPPRHWVEMNASWIAEDDEEAKKRQWTAIAGVERQDR